MRIRRYGLSDAAEVAELFRKTVWEVCASDYTFQELSAWAPDDIDPEIWAERFSDQYSIVAVADDGSLCGFASASTPDRYVDMLYVRAGDVGHGVGKLLLKALEAEMKGVISVYASDTARSFFHHMGYEVIRENFVVRNGVRIRNWYMEKPF